MKTERGEVADLAHGVEVTIGEGGGRVRKHIIRALVFAYRRGRQSGWRDCYDKKQLEAANPELPLDKSGWADDQPDREGEMAT